MMKAVLLLAAVAIGQVETPPPRDPRNWPAAVMDTARPALPRLEPGAVLILSKTNGYRNEEQIVAAGNAIEQIVRAQGRTVFATENAAVMNPSDLRRFSVVVLNSVSGRIFTRPQQAAFRDWIEHGGGVVLLHGAGGDPSYAWHWYRDALLGTQFVGHPPRADQFQPARIDVVAPDHPAMRGLPRIWERTDEWYAFDKPPQGDQTHILATLDEATFRSPPNQRMGAVHPIIWTRCIARGRAIFSALGHRAESYDEPLHRRLLSNAIAWAAGNAC
jgi:type 1 glutamine amidotransferase